MCVGGCNIAKWLWIETRQLLNAYAAIPCRKVVREGWRGGIMSGALKMTATDIFWGRIRLRLGETFASFGVSSELEDLTTLNVAAEVLGKTAVILGRGETRLQ